ncbi:type III pantothenate kinase [Portibacter marinus]|uniref:type III pantothenate kinase n=1 Tax=Portibacter marinus TaxID=2898660 RepID=UPI001F3B1993|nr:type III pantothenate kinase [Portibacter marinus]
MNLCIDIGNSYIKIAIIEENEILHKDVRSSFSVSDLDRIRKDYNFQRVGISASGRIPKDLMHHLQKNDHLFLLNADARLPIEIKYNTPKTLGRDRIAGVVGANALYPETDSCVIDIGTCITYDVILKSKTYIGGNIAPGVELRLKSMHDYTAALPLVKRGGLENLLGLTTEEALQNGATLGTLLEIESFIRRIREKHDEINVILTGGDADFFAKKINSEIFVNPNLVLIGLNVIMNFND